MSEPEALSSQEKRVLFFRMFSLLTLAASTIGIKIFPYYFYMTAAEVNKFFREGKSQVDGYKTTSPHQRWLAVDLVIMDDAGSLVWSRVPEYETLGVLWEALGGEWGGRWKSLNDIYHFQLKNWAD